MTDDIEQRLTEAAEALREYELTVRRCAELRDRIDAMTTSLTGLRARHSDERKDVERLEGLSLTRLLVSLRGARDDALARERAEADAARYRLAEAEGRLKALRRERAAAHARLSELATAPSAYDAALEAKEQRLSGSGDPRNVRLLEVADERGRITGQMREAQEALRAAGTAWDALTQVGEILRSASGWSTVDVFLGGGPIVSAVKHSRLDEAAEAAAHADECLAVLRTELADIDRQALTVSNTGVDSLTQFVDVWLDNVFTDLSVGRRIKQAEHNVARSMELVREVRRRLEQRLAQDRARLVTLETERRDLLTRP